MKRLMLLLLLNSFFFIGQAQVSSEEIGGVLVNDYCDWESCKLAAKQALVPFKTEYGKNYRITLRPHAQIKEFEVSLYYGVPYRFVVNMEGMPLDAKVLFTDKDRFHKKATTLWESNEKGVSVFDIGGEDAPEAPRKIYVTIFIPATDNVDPKVREKACINFVYGTKVLYDDDY